MIVEMYTGAARRSLPGSIDNPARTVASLAQLHAAGRSYEQIRAQVDARRWQRIGRAVVLHNGALTRNEKIRAVLLDQGPRALLTSVTAAEQYGLTGWERGTVHLLVPGGTHVRRPAGIEVRVHFTADWEGCEKHPTRRLHGVSPALLIAGAGFTSPRPACAILAASVQQRLVGAAQLRAALDVAIRLRHRHAMALAIADIEQGAHALSEIDFARLCRRHGLPEPRRQAMRTEPSGRVRYLDAMWLLTDGRRVVVEVDGALHLTPRNWWSDQYRQNELVIAGDIVLRFPSVVVRTAEDEVAGQLRRALGMS